jgi:DNA-binding CsgD family transcriptional regulator
MNNPPLPTAKELVVLYRLIHELCEMGDDAYGWRGHLYSVIMPMIDAHVGAAYVMRYPVDDSNIWPTMPLAMHISATENWQKFVAEGDLTSHPCNNGVMARIGTDFTCPRQELVDDGTWNASAFRAAVANPAGWDQTLMSQTMISPPGYVNGIDFMRAVGKPPFGPREVGIVHYLHGELARLWRRPDPLGVHQLPDRQREVLDGIRRGESRKAIADKMGVSDHTVHSYEKALFARAEVTSRGELLARLAKRVQPNLLP